MATSGDPQIHVASVVLVGVDFSETSLGALKTAENLARTAPRAELHLVHVLAMPMAPHTPESLYGPAEMVLRTRMSKARDELDRLVAASTNGIDRVVGHLRAGSPAAAIVEVASDIEADLVVVGAEHSSGVSRLVFGSVADKVARAAPCPVLIVRQKTAPAWAQIEPPCPDCAHVQRTTRGAKLWCAHHSERHVRPHTYHEWPSSYGIGTMTFRSN